MPDRRARRRGVRARAQTTLDFAMGTVVFLLATGTVLTAVPGLVDPAVDRGSADPAVADRTADAIARDVLAGPGPYVLDESRTSAFFANSTAEARDRLGLGAAVRFNVTLSNGTDRLAVGPTPPDGSESVYTARRVTVVDGEHRDLRVTVW